MTQICLNLVNKDGQILSNLYLADVFFEFSYMKKENFKQNSMIIDGYTMLNIDLFKKAIPFLKAMAKIRTKKSRISVHVFNENGEMLGGSDYYDISD